MLEGKSDSVHALDDIGFAATPRGTRITYTADISLLGAFSIVEPLLKGALDRVGKNAVRGLQAALSGESSPPGRSRLTDLQDRLIVPGLLGFTNVGYHWHKRSWKPLAVSLRGRTVVVTGATSGLGQAAASQLAELGARVILVGRNPDKAEATRREIVAATGNDNVAVALADLSLLADVRKLAQQLLETEPRIHVLVNNAGVLLNQRTTTAEGNETALATNLLAPYLLTQMLLPRLRESAPSRIINVSSGGMYATGLALDDLQYEKSDLRRQPRLRPHQARAGHPDRDVGGATEGQRRGRPCDASGLGGHAGCRRFAPRISRDHPALPAHGGCRARIPSRGLRPRRKRPRSAACSGSTASRTPPTSSPAPIRRRRSGRNCGTRWRD